MCGEIPISILQMRNSFWDFLFFVLFLMVCAGFRAFGGVFLCSWQFGGSQTPPANFGNEKDKDHGVPLLMIPAEASWPQMGQRFGTFSLQKHPPATAELKFLAYLLLCQVLEHPWICQGRAEGFEQAVLCLSAVLLPLNYGHIAVRFMNHL